MTVQHTDPATAEDRPEIQSPSADDSEVPEGHAHQPRELTPAQEAKAAHELSAPMSDNQLKRFGELIEMHADYGHALSIAGERLLLEEATYWRRIAHEQDVALTTTVDRHNAALSELEAAQARLGNAEDAIREAVHIAICEDSPEECVEWRGKCVKAAEASARALGLGEEADDA